MPTPSRVYSTRDPQATQRRLLEAGLDVFGRKGYAAASVNEIVRQAGCSKGAFYCHFASKEDFLLTILESRISGNNQRLLELCRWEGDTAGWLGRLFETLVGFSQNEPNLRALSAEFMALGMRNASVGRRIAEMHCNFRDLVAGVIAASEKCSPGQVQADARLIAIALGAMLDGLLIHASIEPDVLPMPETARRLRPLLAAWCAPEPR